MDAGSLDRFYLDDQLIEPRKRKVSRRNEERHLPPKAAEVLVCLAQRPGEALSHDEILAQVWGPGNGSVDALSHAISDIRHALGDLPNRPRFIQTLPKRGYRLLQPPSGSPGSAPTQVPAMEAPEWWQRLLRHGVVQAAVAYVFIGWGIVQVADTMFDKIGLPPWSEQFATFAVISGFPIVVLLAWCLEFVKGRIELDRGDQPIGLFRGLARNYLAIVIAYGIAAVGTGVYQATIGFSDTTINIMQEVATPQVVPIEENSIAVLPFLNNDGSEETQIFANGLMDDVITRLSRVPGLHVASRGDAATLEPNSPSARVRQRLRVAMYIEGSVQIEGDVIRVIVQIIDSSNGFHILSRTFDRPRRDFFEIRDEITKLTVASLRPALPETTQMFSSSTEDDPEIDAYLLYRHGIDELDKPLSAQAISSALSWFNAALDVDPEYAAAYAGKCRAHVSEFKELDDPVSITNAESACATALELNPNLDIVHVALGNLHYKRGRYDDSAAAYLNALRINSQNVVAMTGLAEVYLLKQQPEEAERLLVSAISLQPGNSKTYNHLGTLYSRRGHYGDAATQFRAVIEIDDHSMRGYSNLGGALMLDDRFDEAALVYQKSLEIEPHANTYANLGLMHYYLGQFEEAAAALRKGIDLAPGEYMLWMNLGDILAASGDHASSRDSFHHALRLAQQVASVNPLEPGISADLAWIHAVLSDEAEAKRLIKRAAEGIPDDPYVDFIHGLILNESGDLEGSINALETAISKGYPRVFVAAEPHLRELRKHPRFSALVDATGG
jgi:TolB-like protein/DNA-binding winged helix-turn-helix (wHTH) protein/Flp pilus assembly protein TadD